MEDLHPEAGPVHPLLEVNPATHASCGHGGSPTFLDGLDLLPEDPAGDPGMGQAEAPAHAAASVRPVHLPKRPRVEGAQQLPGFLADPQSVSEVAWIVVRDRRLRAIPCTPSHEMGQSVPHQELAEIPDPCAETPGRFALTRGSHLQQRGISLLEVGCTRGARDHDLLHAEVLEGRDGIEGHAPGSPLVSHTVSHEPAAPLSLGDHHVKPHPVQETDRSLPDLGRHVVDGAPHEESHPGPTSPGGDLPGSGVQEKTTCQPRDPVPTPSAWGQPEPETPVTPTKQPRGNLTSIFLRLCSWAPMTSKYFCAFRLAVYADELEKLGKDGNFSNANTLLDKFEGEIFRIRHFTIG